MSDRPDMLSDAEIVQAVGTGDREAYAILVDRHLASVFGVALRLLGNRAEAEDAAQDTFMRALDRLYLYNPEFPFRAWLLKIATNTALNRLRSRKRERQMQDRLAEQQRTATPEEPVTVPSRAEWQGWLDQLDETQRTAIVLFHFHEMPYAEIAEVLDMPINTVRTHLHRARKRLRELMTRGNHPEDGSWQIAITNG